MTAFVNFNNHLINVTTYGIYHFVDLDFEFVNNKEDFIKNGYDLILLNHFDEIRTIQYIERDKKNGIIWNKYYEK